MNQKLLPWGLLIFAAGLSAVYGHDYWFMTDGEDYWLHRGHRFSLHSGAAEVPFDPAILTSARCLPQSDA